MKSEWISKKGIIGQAPMDGVTDVAFRYITDTIGRPDVLFTEFTSVEGIARGAVRLITPFITHETTTLIVAQLYGTTPENFYKTAALVACMGFDGVDINMGCPDRSISKKGAGAGLIRTPGLAKKIIKSVKQAVMDVANGLSFENIDLSEEIIDEAKKYSRKTKFKELAIPVSVKTRIGYDKIETASWIPLLLQENLYAITIHGRTLKQMYEGKSNWEEIEKAKEFSQGTNTKVIGNGDILGLDDAKHKIKKYNLDGVLIGRASMGNPWVFREGYIPSNNEKINTAIEHCRVFTKMTPHAHFASLRKHLAWYMKGIPESHSIKDHLMKANSLEDVERIFSENVRVL